jgi:hypothetical protein
MTAPDRDLSENDHKLAPSRPAVSGSGALEQSPSNGCSVSAGGGAPGQSVRPRNFGLRDLGAWVEEATAELPPVAWIRLPEQTPPRLRAERTWPAPRSSSSLGEPEEWLGLTRTRSIEIARLPVRASAGYVLRAPYKTAVSAMEIEAGWVEGIRDRDGKLVRDPLEEHDKIVFDFHLSRPLVRTFYVVDALMRGARSVTDRLALGRDRLRGRSYASEIEKAVLRDFLSRPGWLMRRLPTGKPPGAPTTTVNDHSGIERLWELCLIAARKVVGNDREKILRYAAVCFFHPQSGVNLRAVADMLGGRRGTSKSTLYELRKRLEERFR